MVCSNRLRALSKFILLLVAILSLSQSGVLIRQPLKHQTLYSAQSTSQRNLPHKTSSLCLHFQNLRTPYKNESGSSESDPNDFVRLYGLLSFENEKCVNNSTNSCLVISLSKNSSFPNQFTRKKFYAARNHFKAAQGNSPKNIGKHAGVDRSLPAFLFKINGQCTRFSFSAFDHSGEAVYILLLNVVESGYAFSKLGSFITVGGAVECQKILLPHKHGSRKIDVDNPLQIPENCPEEMISFCHGNPTRQTALPDSLLLVLHNFTCHSSACAAHIHCSLNSPRLKGSYLNNDGDVYFWTRESLVNSMSCFDVDGEDSVPELDICRKFSQFFVNLKSRLQLHDSNIEKYRNEYKFCHCPTFQIHPDCLNDKSFSFKRKFNDCLRICRSPGIDELDTSSLHDVKLGEDNDLTHNNSQKNRLSRPFSVSSDQVKCDSSSDYENEELVINSTTSLLATSSPGAIFNPTEPDGHRTPQLPELQTNFSEERGDSAKLVSLLGLRSRKQHLDVCYFFYFLVK